MPAARKRTPRKAAKAKLCPVCKGSGEVSSTVRVGRRQRPVGQQTGYCLACLGSGEATD